MRDRFLNFIEALRSSLWLIPLLMVLGAMLLAYLTLMVDMRYLDEISIKDWWFFTGSPESARSILGTIAGSMITVAGLVFSLTMVTLTLASQQFGPRLMRSFIGDRGNQFVLGTFIATFLYCLIILRAVRSIEELSFIPHVSVMMALLLSISSLVVLIYFIHHISTSIQVDYLVSRVGNELEGTIRRLYPEHNPERPDDETGIQARREMLKGLEGLEEDMAEVESTTDGYIQAIDYELLLRIASRHKLIIKIKPRAGHYLLQNYTLATVYPAASLTPRLCRTINEAFILGYRRTPTQDVEFGIDSLVEIALRALSPSTNDPFTALSAVDRLGVSLTLLASRDMPSPYIYDKKGDLRLIKHPVTFGNVCEAAFNQIRQLAPNQTAIMLHLLEIIGALADEVHRSEDIEALRKHSEMLRRAVLEHVVETFDRDAIEERYRNVMNVLHRPEAPEVQPGAQVDFTRDSL